MMFLDPHSFDTQHYVFSFVRREFLGSVRTWVYDVHPKVAGMGRFYGRIWVEDEDGNIVRFNGTYTGPQIRGRLASYYFHFDSWRMNVQPGIWLPVAVYVEETSRTEDDKSRRTEGPDALLGLLAEAAHAGEREREREGGRRGGQERRLAGRGSAAGHARLGYAGGKQRDRPAGGGRAGGATDPRRL